MLEVLCNMMTGSTDRSMHLHTQAETAVRSTRTTGKHALPMTKHDILQCAVCTVICHCQS